MNIQSWFPLGLTDLIYVQSKELSRESPPAPQFKSINSSALSLLSSPTLTSVHDYWKNHSFDWWTLVGEVMSLLVNMLSRLVIAFLPRSKHLLISWLQSPFAVILESSEIKSVTVSVVSPSFCHEVMRLDAIIIRVYSLFYTFTYFANIEFPWKFDNL